MSWLERLLGTGRPPGGNTGPAGTRVQPRAPAASPVLPPVADQPPTLVSGRSDATTGHRIPPPPERLLRGDTGRALTGGSRRPPAPATSVTAGERDRPPALERWSLVAPRDRPARPEDARWVPPGEPVTVQGRTIPGGMLFVSAPSRSGHARAWQAGFTATHIVDPGLKIHWHAPAIPGPHDYCRSYSGLSPNGRAAYLGWIADGRRDPSAPLPFPFLFLCGLERRLLSDDPDPAERALLVAELVRLRGLYRHHGLFEQTSTALLRWVRWREVLARPGWLAGWTPDPNEDSEEMSVPLRLATAWKVAVGERVPFELALATLLCVPPWQGGLPSRHAVTRTRAAFVALMRQRFAARFPKGLKLRNRPSSELTLAYRSLNTGLVVAPLDLGRRLPDPFDLNWSRLVRLCVQAISDLAPHSRAVRPDRSGDATPEAIAALPAELHAVRHAQLRQIDDWLATLPDLARLTTAELWSGCLGSASAPGAGGLRATGSILAGLGYGLEPDPALGRSPALPGGFFQVFRAGGIAPGGDVRAVPGPAFGVGCLAIASLAALSEAGPHGARAGEVEAVIGGLPLAPAEQLRLRAHALGLSATTPKLAALRRAARMVEPAERPRAAALILDLARSAHMVAPRQVALLEALHDALELDRAPIYPALHQGVMSRGATPASANRPAEPGIAGSDGLAGTMPVVLDPAAIGRIREETRGVSELLAAVYADDEPDRTATPAPATPGRPGSGADGPAGLLQRLDAAHAAFLRTLLARRQWPRAEYEAEARRHGLMPDGATETINDWAFDAFDEALVEEEAPIEDGAPIEGWAVMVVNAAALRALEGMA